MVKGCVADGKPMIGLIGRAMVMVQTVGRLAAVVVVDMMAVGIRQDLGEVELPKRSPQGLTLLRILVLTSSALTLEFIYFFLSLMHALQKRQTESPPHLNLKGVVCKIDNN
jgi:hypothetical protein